MLETLVDGLRNFSDWLRQGKLRHLRSFSNHVPLRFLICQYVVAHGNSVAEGDLKKWLTEDLRYDPHSVYVALRRMEGKELGHSDEKILVETNGNLSLANPFPQFTLVKGSFLESWKFVTVPIAICAILFAFIIPDLSWTRFFLICLFISIVIWVADDYVIRRVKWK